MYHKKRTLMVYLSLSAFLFIAANTAAYESSGCGGCDGSYFEKCVDRFNDKIDSFSGWGQSFSQGCGTCQEDYYKSASAGGSENVWVDSTDIHFRNSHCGRSWDSGWSKNLSSVPFNGADLVPSEAHRSYGNRDLEWIAFKCCKLLRDDSKVYWYTTFDGLHLMLGFKTNSYGAVNFGRKWAKKMKKRQVTWWTIPSDSVTQAWFNTTDKTQPNKTVARVLAEVKDNYNDHLTGNGYTSSDPVYNGYYWWWDHKAGSPPYLQVNNLDFMNVYEVVPRDVNNQYIQQLASAFTMDSESEIGDLGDSLIMVDSQSQTKVLEVSKETGYYHYKDNSRLFVPDTSLGMYPPSQAQARADEFLDIAGLYPFDAGDSSVEFDTLTRENADTQNAEETHNLNTSVVYARHIPADAAEDIFVSVAGPGARTKLYIAPDGDIIGAMGNWRQIVKNGEIAVNSSQQTWNYFENYGEPISLTGVETDYAFAVPNIQSATQAYYEYPGSVADQKELIPCWIFQADYYDENEELITTADTFIPAKESYFPPMVEITQPIDGSTFNQGQTVGFDSQVVQNFGTPPYTFTWESSVDGPVSNLQSFSSDSLTVHCPDTSCDCSAGPQTISVTVTDAKGATATDSVQITILGPCEECNDCSDLNLDNITNLQDMSIMASNWLKVSIP